MNLSIIKLRSVADYLIVAPWGRLWHATKDMIAGSKTQAEGGTGIAKEFWEWSEAQIKLQARKE